MKKEELDLLVAAQKAEFERLKKLIDGVAEDPRYKTTPGMGTQDWSKCWNASVALHSAENKAITDKYDPIIDKARKEGDALRQQITDLNEKNRIGGMDYEEYKKEYDRLKQEVDKVNAVFDEARSARKQALDDAFARSNVRLDELNQHAVKPKKDTSQTLNVQSEDAKKVLEDFHKKFNDEWYKTHPPKENNGALEMSFKNESDALSFFREQAQKDRNFVVIDGATGKVIGFSKDGQFCHADGKPFKDNDKLQPSEMTLDQFYASQVKKGNDNPVMQPLGSGSPQPMDRALQESRSLDSGRSTPTSTTPSDSEPREESSRQLK